MKILAEHQIKALGMTWPDLFNVVGETLQLYNASDTVQPLKPYLRYRDLTNRIIAMPAFVGGGINMAGLKWIASFPKNPMVGKARAHSVTILNNADDGVPVCIINTSLISIIRTASVSGWILREYLGVVAEKKRTVGIIGFGPIGQFHLKMIREAFPHALDQVLVYDINANIRQGDEGESTIPLRFCDSWQEVFTSADVLITCTVSPKPYIDLPPKKGSLHLNVSLRDYFPECGKHMDFIVVDNWEEVCRENTDIEQMHKKIGLNKNDVYELSSEIFSHHLKAKLSTDATVMINPMGMAIFDIAVGTYYYRLANSTGIGLDI